MNTVKGYEKLVAVYQDAHDQAAKGKGDERHANGQPFHEQRMQQISGLLRSSDGMAFQAIKKLTEGLQFEDHARREAELLGALNYIAGIVIYYRELRVNGFEPVALMQDEILVGNTIRRKSETPLSDEQLRAGGWWCDRTGGNRGALRRKNIDYVECQDTNGNYVFYEASCNSDVKEIIRKGNEFYYV